MGEARDAEREKEEEGRRESFGKERSPRREFERPQITGRWCEALEVGFVGRWKRLGEVGGSDNRGVDGWTGGRVTGVGWGGVTGLGTGAK